MFYFIILLSILTSLLFLYSFIKATLSENNFSIIYKFSIAAFSLFVIVLFIILFDMLGIQGDLGGGILVFPLILLATPPVFCGLFLIYLSIYAAMFHIIEKIWKNIFQTKFNEIIISIALVILSIIFFQWLWWSYFYTEVSLPRRVIGWNIITIIFPIIALISAILMDIKDEDDL